MGEVEHLNDAEEYEQRIKDLPVLLPQSSYFGVWQEKVGQPVSRRSIDGSDGRTDWALQCIGSDSVPGMGRFGVIPYGPTAREWTPGSFAELFSCLKELAEEKDYFFIRFDPHPLSTSLAEEYLNEWFKPAPLSSYNGPLFQPRTEWWLDLTASEEELFRSMHKKHRYNIRKAEREGVEVEVVTQGLSSYFSWFWELLQVTARRSGFTLHSEKYYQTVLEEGEKNGKAALLISRINGAVEGVSMLGVYRRVGYFLYTGSSDEARRRRATYLSRWRGLQYLKEQGFTYASFGGVTPDDNNNWSNFSEFKRNFGGFPVQHGRFFDYVHHPVLYRAYLLRKGLKKLR